jgi:hypothetical protein
MGWRLEAAAEPLVTVQVSRLEAGLGKQAQEAVIVRRDAVPGVKAAHTWNISKRLDNFRTGDQGRSSPTIG